MKLAPAALLVPAALLLLAPARAHAAPFTEPAAIDAAVAQFTGTPQGALGGAAQPVDRRLRLAPCANPLSLSWYAGRRDTVLVQCPDAGAGACSCRCCKPPPAPLRRPPCCAGRR